MRRAGWVTLGKEKLAGVRQKLTILSPEFTDAIEAEDDSGFEASYDRMSDAEQVMLLHRDARRLQPPEPDRGKLQ